MSNFKISKLNLQERKKNKKSTIKKIVNEYKKYPLTIYNSPIRDFILHSLSEFHHLYHQRICIPSLDNPD